jgi:hypothetical protein
MNLDPSSSRVLGLVVLFGLASPRLLPASIHFTDVPVLVTNGWPIIGLPSNPYSLDMDGDGTTDLIFRSQSDGFSVFPQAGAAVWATAAGPLDLNTLAVPLPAGTEITASLQPLYLWDNDSINGSLLTSAMNEGAIGLFTGQNAYLGVQFLRSGETFLGWVHLDTSYVGLNTGNLLGYAWEDVSGQAILAGQVPEPNSLALLVLSGCLFLAHWLWRKRRPI